MEPHQRRLPLNEERSANAKEADRLETESRRYTHERRAAILEIADSLSLGLTPVEMEKIYIHANGVSQGNMATFKIEAARKVTELGTARPVRAHGGAMQRWFNDALDNQQKARLDVADWYDEKNYVYLDIEATGLTDDDVPVEIAMCDCNGESIMELYTEPLDGKGEPVHMSKSATEITGYNDDDLWQFQPLENYPYDWLKFEVMHVVFVAFNAWQDQRYLVRALKNAVERHPERRDLADAMKYIQNRAHWIDTRPALVEAIGLNPETPTGRFAKLEDVARAVNALPPGEDQDHSALSDAQLLAAIVRNIRQESEGMGVIDDQTAEIKRLEKENNELRNQIEAGRASSPHHEARTVMFTNIVVGVGDEQYPVNFTIREGMTADRAVADVFEHIKGLMLIRNDKRVTSFAVGWPTNSKFVELKARKQEERQAPPPPKDPPAGDFRSTPPNDPPPNKPPTGGTGDRKYERGISVMKAVTRKNTPAYIFRYLQGDGQISPYELEVNKPEYVERLEALLAERYDLEQWPIGHTRTVGIKVSWTKGKPLSEGKFYRDDMQFEYWDYQP